MEISVNSPEEDIIAFLHSKTEEFTFWAKGELHLEVESKGMSKTVALDFAGYIYLITDASSVAEVEAEAETNPRISIWNAAYEIDQTPDDFNDSQAYPTTVIPFAELASYERSGCEYGECHNLSFGPDCKSEKYCDDHAGSVTDEYWDVEVIWEGSVISNDSMTDYSEVVQVSEATQKDVAEARSNNTLNEEYGVRVTVQHHVHEFDTREESEDFEGDCSCGSYSESFETVYDSKQDEPGENGLPEEIECAVCGQDASVPHTYREGSGGTDAPEVPCPG